MQTQLKLDGTILSNILNQSFSLKFEVCHSMFPFTSFNSKIGDFYSVKLLNIESHVRLKD